MMYRFYVGSNNKTKVLELDKIEKIVSSYVDGFTITQGVGYWKGERESVAIVEVGQLPAIQYHAIDVSLRNGLEQQAIGVLAYNSEIEFI